MQPLIPLSQQQASQMLRKKANAWYMITEKRIQRVEGILRLGLPDRFGNAGCLRCNELVLRCMLCREQVEDRMKYRKERV